MSEKANGIAKRYKELQDRACYILEETDGKALFSKDAWQKDIGSGMTRVMQHGNKIAKAAINFSHVTGPFSAAMKKLLGEDAGSYTATGISSIIHPINPWAPITHMNVRYFELDNGTSWFGGGIDLTPHYIDKQEAASFHNYLKNICDSYDNAYYSKFKPWADEYFFIPHRNETRGVGGIFFDRQKPQSTMHFEQLFAFTVSLTEAYPEIYSKLLNNKNEKAYGEKELTWQSLRRGRYAEFNLAIDRGTKFGLESGGNTESILVSMPPMAHWEYRNAPEPGSPEGLTLSLLKKDIDWLSFLPKENV